MGSVPESDELSVDIRVIKDKVTSLESLMDVLVAASRNDVLPLFIEMFGFSRKKALAYIAANGRRTVREIADLIGSNIANTSRCLGNLEEAMLLSKKRDGRSIIYAKKKWDAYVGLTQKLKEVFKVDDQ